MENYTNIILNPAIIIALIIGACVLLLSYILKTYKTDKVHHKKASKTKPEVRIPPNTREQQKKTQRKRTDQHWSNVRNKQHYSHPWHLTSFKGHTGKVHDLDFSPNGRYLVSCSDDRTVFLWEVKDFKQNDHKSIRVNIEFDYPTFVKWSPDNKAFLIHRYQNNNIEVFKVEKKKDGGIGHATLAHNFPKAHEEEIVGMGISSNGKFIMSCSSKNDLILWDLKGQILTKIDTCLMTTYSAKISPCGKFIFASGFSPDAKVWEVIFSKNGEFQEVKRAYELTGHTSGIYDVNCNVDSSEMATVSKDGTWKLFDTKVEFKKGQDPHVKMTEKYKNPEDETALIALSNNGVVVIAVNNTLQFFSAFTGKLDRIIENIYEGEITRLLFDASNRYLLTTGQRHIMVFHNVTSYKCDIYTAQLKLKEHQTSATKERLQKIIKDSEEFLNTISDE